MQLSYRGVRYNLIPAHVDVADIPVTGHYRGATVSFHQAMNLSAIQQVLHLIYRGVAFDEEISIPAA